MAAALLTAAMALLAAALSAGAPAASADVIHFLNGDDPVEGAVVSEDSRRIVVEVEGGRAVYDRALVDRIERKAWTRPTRASAGASPGGGGAAPTGSSGATAESASAGGATRTGGEHAAPSAASAGDTTGASLKLGRILAESRTATALARARGEGALRAAVEDATGKLVPLGLEALPAIVEALAAETDADVAEALEGALGRQAIELVSGRPLAQALARRIADATPSLVRSAGRYGAAEGATAVFALLDEETRVEAERRSHPDDPAVARRYNALTALRPAVTDALGFSGEPAAAERLLGIAVLAPSGPEKARAGVALSSSLRRVMAEAKDRALARRLVDQALARLEGEPLATLMIELGSGHDPETVGALAGATRRLQSRAAGAPGRRDPLMAAVMSLQGYLRTGEYPEEPLAVEAMLALAGDPDDAVRLSAVVALGTSGNTSAAVVAMLIDRVENDRVVGISAQAHAALVRLNEGVNLGGPAAWRAWAKSRGR